MYLNVFNRKRIYNKNDTGQPLSINFPTNKWQRFFPIALTVVFAVPAILIVYLGYKEPKVKIDANKFKLNGMFGVNMPLTEIAKADTIVWSKMPKFSRIYGISLNKVHRGKFRANGRDVHFSIHSGVSPVIKIVAKDGSVYYINRKDATETRQIFKKLNKQVTN